MFTFGFIWAFLLLPLPLLLRLLVAPYREERPAVHVPFFDDLARVSGETPDSGSAVRKQPLPRQIVVGLCWILLVTAMARPQWIEAPVTREIPTRDVLLGVDLSGSMSAKDFKGAGGKQHVRLDAVKGVLENFLKHRKGDRVGLILFGTAPFIQAPFTEDLQTVQELLRDAQVGMCGPRTAIGDSIGLAINLFKNSVVKERLYILLTDGNDSASSLPPEQAARIAADNGITIFTVAVGDPQAVGEEKLDVKTLKAVASITGGHYFWAGDRDQLDEIYKRIDELSTHKVETVSHRPKKDLYPWPLAGVMVLSMLLHLVRLIKTRRTA